MVKSISLLLLLLVDIPKPSYSAAANTCAASGADCSAANCCDGYSCQCRAVARSDLVPTPPPVEESKIYTNDCANGMIATLDSSVVDYLREDNGDLQPRRLVDSASVIDILEGTEDTVTFNVHQYWINNKKISSVSTFYEHQSGSRCHTFKNVKYGQARQYTAQCSGGVAKVDIYAYDDQFRVVEDISGSIPDDCKISREMGKKIRYSYTLPCTSSCESTCEDKELSLDGNQKDQDQTGNMKITKYDSETIRIDLKNRKLVQIKDLQLQIDGTDAEVKVEYGKTQEIKVQAKPDGSAKVVEESATDDPPASSLPSTSSSTTTTTTVPATTGTPSASSGGVTLISKIVDCVKAGKGCDPREPLNNADPVTIVKQEGDTVTFNVNQVWKSESVSWIAALFQGTNGATTCPKINEVKGGQQLEYTAKCINGSADLTVYVHDGQFKDIEDITSSIPGLCEPSQDLARKIMYKFSVPCKSIRRQLASQVKTIGVDIREAKSIQVKFRGGGGAIVGMNWTDCGIEQEKRTAPAPKDKDSSKTTCKPVKIDFAEFEAGDYINDQLLEDYGINITASSDIGGYTPNDAARIFDTTFPTSETGQILCDNGQGSPGLGSPNQHCFAGGPGVGDAGKPGEPTENCNSLGKALIIQSKEMSCPQENPNGGTITFDFPAGYEIDFHSIDFLNSEAGEPVTTVYHDGGQVTTLSFSEATKGDNGFQQQIVGINAVEKVEIKLCSGGAIGSIMYTQCPPKAGQRLQCFYVAQLKKYMATKEDGRPLDLKGNKKIISITGKEKESVTFFGKQILASGGIEYMALHYLSYADGTWTCSKHTSVKPGALKDKLTAACEDGATLVTVWVADTSFKPLENLSSNIPDMCGYDSSYGGVFMYSFSLPCECD